MAVSFYKSPAEKAARGLDWQNNPVPTGAIIFGYDTSGGTTGKIYVQNGTPGTINSLICYGDMDMESISGLLQSKVDVSQFNKVLKYVGEVATRAALPDDKNVREGDVYRITQTNELYFAKEKLVSNTIQIHFVDREGNQYTTSFDVGANRANVIDIAEYNREISSISPGHNVTPFNDDTKFPSVNGPSQLMSVFTQNGISFLYPQMRMVPVIHPSRGLIVVLVAQHLDLGGSGVDWNPTTDPDAHRFHTVALGVKGSLDINSWRVGAVNQGEFIWCENGVLPSGAADSASIYEFNTFSLGVIWAPLASNGSGTNSIEIDNTLIDNSANPTQGGAVKRYVDNAISELQDRIDSIGSSFDLKGSVANLTALESLTNVQNGDVYYVESESLAYFALVQGSTVTWKPFSSFNLEWK